VRAEYPLALENIARAIEQATEYGLLGDDILGSGTGFRVGISRGAGAFVCGEETALIASIEGRPGTPSPRPPYPAQKGLWGLPTTINNVETWANVPLIINRGASWFSGIGSGRSKGTKVFSLVGKVRNTGLVEVPMGMTLRDIVVTIGGGVADGRTLKAVQTGGPSGGLIPEALLDLPVDYEALTEAGAMMGSGGMIVMDDRTCVVDVARYFMSFLSEESCGKCTPCREGIKAMLAILTRVCEGRGSLDDLARLHELADAVKLSSLCGLGKTAPNPVLSSLHHFRDEYIAHVVKRRCPAGVCKALITLNVDAEKCKGCGRCVKACPVAAISGGKKSVASIIEANCVRCRACLQACKFEAITVT
jgi:NADH-quinone oxidoreductase subunit F